jgi:hypothetical protein
VPRASANGQLEGLAFDAAALLYLPDRLATVGGLTDEQLQELFGRDPFVSHLFELPLGRIGGITLPVRGKDLFHPERTAALLGRALDLARQRGARCVSLTGLIPSATAYGLALADGPGDGLSLTTGHATTTAAVVLNLQSMLQQAGRSPAGEHLGVLGLGSIGQSCLRLLLEVLPHPGAITLCDVFAKQEEVRALARGLCDEHGFRGRIAVVDSDGGLPEALYEATTVLTAVSVPGALDVDRLRPGTVLVDDSYPPAFALDRAVRRAETAADLFFSNAGLVRLTEPVRETLFLPPGTQEAVARFGAEAFRNEVERDPYELTACILSSLLTDRHEGLRPTLGLAAPEDLRGHHQGLLRLGITAARPQCEKYFVPDEVVRRFREQFGAPAAARDT